MDYIEVTDYNGNEVGLILLYTSLLEYFVEYVLGLFTMYVNYLYFWNKKNNKDVKLFFIKAFLFTSSFTN